MRTLSTTSTRARSGIFTSALLAAVLFCGVQSRATCSTITGEEVLLGSALTGYVDVTSYLQVYAYGNVWVVGYDSLPNFEITVDAAGGHVADPTTGIIIGICYAQTGS